MKVTALGEFGLISALAKIVHRGSSNLTIGIGDDAAVWTATSNHEIATTDLLLEGIHFTLDTATWYDLGWKALAVNLSDIAAMGGEPRYALLGLALPTSTDVQNVEELYRGAAAISDRYGMVIAGGDTVRSPQPVVISVTAVGAARTVDGQFRVLRRNAARPGDVVGVTGVLGASAGGLQIMQRRMDVPQKAADALRAAHLRPVPRVPEAQVLLASGVVAAMDISDGLVGDLGKLCQASGVAAVLDPDRVPVSAELSEVFHDRAVSFALYGGEDYELLFCAPPDVFASASAALVEAGLAQATAVGEIIDGEPGSIWLSDRDGKRVVPSDSGYDAFRG